MLKIVAAVRRRPGMTHAEYADYIVNVHGEIAKVEPLGISRYTQSHVYDGAYGSAASQTYLRPFHRDSVTELAFATPKELAYTFGHEYTRTVVGPDAANFAELATNEATLTVETVLVAPIGQALKTKIMHFLVATDPTAIKAAQEGWQTAHDRAMASTPGLAATLAGVIRSDVVLEAPDKAMDAYFGGGDRPPLALVASLWVDDSSIDAFRDYERGVLESGLFDPALSYFLLTREIEIFSK